MSLLLNILWIVLGGGFVLWLEYVLVGLLLCVTVVGIPFGLQCFKIAGLAPTDVQVAELLRKLKNETMFKDVNLIISDWEKSDNKDQQYRKFQIEMTLNPNIDVQAIKDNPKAAAVEVK